MAHNRAVLKGRTNQRVDLWPRRQELAALVLRGMELASEAAWHLAHASDLEEEGRRLAAGGERDAANERFEQASALRASAAELAEPYAATRAQVSWRMPELELARDFHRSLLGRDLCEATDEGTSRTLDGARAWLEDDRSIFGSGGVLGHLSSEHYAADESED